MLLDDIHEPADLRKLSHAQLTELAAEIRTCIVDRVTVNGGHLGSNLGAVELTLAVHRVFDSPRDVILWDTGHQTYVHKLVTGRQEGFATLRQPGGMSGYPSRAESPHDWIENSHASTALSYAHGIAMGMHRGARTTGASWPSWATGRSPAAWPTRRSTTSATPAPASSSCSTTTGGRTRPTVSRLSAGLTHLRLSPSYVHARERARHVLRAIPGLGGLAYSSLHGLTSAVREIVTPHRFFEALGVRYAGPIDGHDIAGMEQALAHATEWGGPIVVHVLTQKGRGYAPAEEDDVQRLHDFKVQPTAVAPSATIAPATYTDAFTRAVLDAARHRPEVVAITAAMPGPTGPPALPGRVPRPVPRRGHRRAARRHRRGGHGHGRAAARGGHLLHVLQPRLRPGQPRRGAARPARGLRPRPGRDHRRRRAQPPRRPRPVAHAVDPGDDGLRAVVGPGGGGDARRGAEPGGPLGHPVPEDARPPGTRRRRRRGALRRAWSAGATARSACWRWASWSRRPRRRPASWPPTAWTPRCGTSGWCRPPTPPCWPTPPPTAWSSRWRTASGWAAPARSSSTPCGASPRSTTPCPRCASSGCLPATSPRASPTGSWPSSAWTGRASPRP